MKSPASAAYPKTPKTPKAAFKSTRSRRSPRTKAAPTVPKGPARMNTTPRQRPQKPIAATNKDIPRNKMPPGVKLQPHIQKTLMMPKRSGTRAAVYELSMNTLQPNPRIGKAAKPARYGTTAGLQGPEADHLRPIVNEAPRAVMDPRQLLVPSKNNYIPDEWGVTNRNAFPMQEIVPPSGGKWSGRTGPIR